MAIPQMIKAGPLMYFNVWESLTWSSLVASEHSKIFRGDKKQHAWRTPCLEFPGYLNLCSLINSCKFHGIRVSGLTRKPTKENASVPYDWYLNMLAGSILLKKLKTTDEEILKSTTFVYSCYCSCRNILKPFEIWKTTNPMNIVVPFMILRDFRLDPI